ncbi:MAG: Clp protease ClpP [Prevotella sp.]|nr:Clp protease ClpP [Prevotella sp.]
MNRFFNIIPGNGSCCLLLYGEIGGEVNSGDVMRELIEAERSYGRIDVRINSVGGEVYAGIAIFNALRQSKADIHIYIDGIAASMASAIALCGKPVEMSRYARLMVHTVRGGCWGTKKDMADCIRELETLEGILCQMYASKLGKSEDEIRSLYFDGDDHWLSAQEALDQGFIDGIYDVEDTPSVMPLSDKMTNDEIYATFNNRLLLEPQTDRKMGLLDELKKNPKFKDCTSEEAALQVVAQLTQTVGSAEALAAENATLKKENQAFKDEKAAAFVAEKQKMLDDAEKCGKINAVTRPAFAALLESDFEKGKKALEELMPTKRVVDELRNDGKKESAWDKRKAQILDRYEKNQYA